VTRLSVLLVATMRAIWAAQVAAPMLDHQQDVEATQEDGVDVGEVDREDRVSLRCQDLPPARSRP
jgi:hypothetical protein